MKKTLSVKTIASSNTTIRRVLHQLANITLYYLEKLRNCYINWIHFVSAMNTWTVFIPCSSSNSVEKMMQKTKMCLIMCREPSLLTKKNRGVDKMPSIARKEALEKNV